MAHKMKMKPEGGMTGKGMSMSQGRAPKSMMAGKPMNTASGKSGKGPMSVMGMRDSMHTMQKKGSK